MSELERLSPESAKELITQVIGLMKQSPLYVITLVENIFSEANPETNEIRTQIVEAIKSRITPMMVKNLLSEKVTDSLTLTLIENQIGKVEQLNPAMLAAKADEIVDKFIKTCEEPIQKIVQDLQGSSAQQISEAINKVVAHISEQLPNLMFDNVRTYVDMMIQRPEFAEKTASYIKDAIDEKMKYVFKVHELKLDAQAEQYTSILVPKELADKAFQLLNVAFNT